MADLGDRRTYIGGSEVGTIMGVNPYQSPLELYHSKVADEPPEDIDNPFMEAGRYLEDTCARWYCDKTGRKVINDNREFHHKQFNVLVGHIDRRIVDNGDGFGPGVLECKTTSAYSDWGELEVPLGYYYQLQFYFALTGYQWGAFALLKGGNDFQIHRCDRNQTHIDALINACVDFWNNHIVPRVPPAMTCDRDLPANSVAFPIEAAKETYDAVYQIARHKARESASKQAREALELQVKIAMGHADTLMYNGNPIATYKTTKAGSRRFLCLL